MKKTIKVIELLNMIANEEEVPLKVKFRGTIYEYDKYNKDYYNISAEYNYLFTRLFYKESAVLNIELEIIEKKEKPKKIEELDRLKHFDLVDKFNELTRAINYLLKKDSEK